jgi:uncharacterized coiled-coil protein SlyX
MTEISKSEVSNPVADQIDVGPPPVQLARGRSHKGTVVAIVAIVLGAGAAFAWLNYGDRLSELAFLVGAPGSTAPTAAGDGVAAADFAAFQQQTSASLQSATQLLAEQRTELKRLSDQLAGLTARIDGLQSAITPAAPAASASVTAPAAAVPVVAAHPRPAPAAPRKRPAAPPAAGAISLGGAPLPTPAR